MKRAAKKLCGLALAVVVALGGLVAAPMSASAANEIQAGQPTITPSSTEVVFAGHTWVVVAGKGNATFDTDGNSVTLLLKSGDGGFSGYTQAYFNAGTGTNIYPGYQLNQAMQGINTAISTTSAVEQGLIMPRYLNEVAVTNPGQYETMTAQEYVWPLSSSEYAAIGSAQAYAEGVWWLRSPNFDSFAYVGSAGGGLVDYGVLSTWAVRPAFNLNLFSVLFTSAAVGGKPGTAGLSQVAALPANGALKFTMTDPNLTISNVTATSVSVDTITFSYDAAASGSSTYNALSAIVTDSSGTLKYYGRLDDAPTQNGTGSASVTVPGGLAATDKLLVFIEQANPDSANMTDFASEPVQISRAAPTGLASVACTTAANNNGQITGTTAEMEYSTDGINWLPCTASPTIGLAPGTTYQVRYSGKVNGAQAMLASPAATGITVGAYTAAPGAPALTVTPGDSQLALSWEAPADTGSSPITGYEYSVSTGADNWQTVPGGATATSHTATGLTNGTAYTVKVRAVNTEGAGAAASATGTPTASTPTPTLAVAANNSITPPSGTVTAGVNFTFTAAGHRQSAAGSTTGDTRYVPASWSINPFGDFPQDGPYSATTKVDSAGSHTITVTFQLQQWSGSAWVNVTGSTDTKTAAITVQAASSSSSTSASTSESSSTATGGSPQTGDTGSLGLWAIVGLSSAAMLGGLLLLVRRRRVREK